MARLLTSAATGDVAKVSRPLRRLPLSARHARGHPRLLPRQQKRRHTFSFPSQATGRTCPVASLGVRHTCATRKFKRMKKRFVLLLPLLSLSLLQSCAFGPCGPVLFWNWKEPPMPGVSYSGGDGSSIEKAVRIEGAGSKSDSIRAEEVWTWNHNLFYNQNVVRPKRAREERGSMRYDSFTIQTKRGQSKTIYFDVTRATGK